MKIDLALNDFNNEGLLNAHKKILESATGKLLIHITAADIQYIPEFLASEKSQYFLKLRDFLVAIVNASPQLQPQLNFVQKIDLKFLPKDIAQQFFTGIEHIRCHHQSVLETGQDLLTKLLAPETEAQTQYAKLQVNKRLFDEQGATQIKVFCQLAKTLGVTDEIIAKDMWRKWYNRAARQKCTQNKAIEQKTMVSRLETLEKRNQDLFALVLYAKDLLKKHDIEDLSFANQVSVFENQAAKQAAQLGKKEASSIDPEASANESGAPFENQTTGLVKDPVLKRLGKSSKKPRLGSIEDEGSAAPEVNPIGHVSNPVAQKTGPSDLEEGIPPAKLPKNDDKAKTTEVSAPSLALLNVPIPRRIMPPVVQVGMTFFSSTLRLHHTWSVSGQEIADWVEKGRPKGNQPR